MCPLTTLEMWLRSQARGSTYAGNFIEHWLQALLFWQAPPWVFTAVYTLFGLAVGADHNLYGVKDTSVVLINPSVPSASTTTP